MFRRTRKPHAQPSTCHPPTPTACVKHAPLQLDEQLEKMELDTALPLASQAKRLLAALDFEWECEAASRKLLALSDFDATRKKVLREVGTCLCGA